MKDKNIVGQAFQNANQLKKQDFEEDKLEEITLSNELLKLAARDVRTYKKRLEKRLQDTPEEWKSTIELLQYDRKEWKKEVNRLGKEGLAAPKEVMNKIGEFGLSNNFSSANPIPIDVM